MPIKNQLNQSALVKVYRAKTVMNGHFEPKQALFWGNYTRTKFEWNEPWKSIPQSILPILTTYIKLCQSSQSNLRLFWPKITSLFYDNYLYQYLELSLFGSWPSKCCFQIHAVLKSLPNAIHEHKNMLNTNIDILTYWHWHIGCDRP